MHNANVQRELRLILWDIKHDPQGAIGNAIMAIGYALHAIGDGNLVPSRIMIPATHSGVFNDYEYSEDEEFDDARIFSGMVASGQVTARDLQYYLLILDRMYNMIPADRRY